MSDILIVDGYNVIHAWPPLKRALVEHGPEEARRGLIEALAAHAVATQARTTVVFDSARRVDRHTGPEYTKVAASSEEVEGITIRFAAPHSSADHVIERLVKGAVKKVLDGSNVVVATSDRLVRDMVRAMGASTMSALSLQVEVERVQGDTRRHGERLADEAVHRRRLEHRIGADVRERLERIRRGER